MYRSLFQHPYPVTRNLFLWKFQFLKRYLFYHFILHHTRIYSDIDLNNIVKNIFWINNFLFNHNKRNVKDHYIPWAWQRVTYGVYPEQKFSNTMYLMLNSFIFHSDILKLLFRFIIKHTSSASDIVTTFKFSYHFV